MTKMPVMPIIRSMTRRIFPNPDPCTGCFNCMMACAQHRTGGADPAEAGIRVDLDPFSGIHGISICRQCDRARCAETCPRNAITRSTGTGAWTIDRSLCIACGACIDACPFQAMFLHPVSGRPVKCDLCGGDDPACVRACHFGVLHPAESLRIVPRGIPAEDLDPGLGRE